MSFSAAASTELQKFSKATLWTLEWRTAFAPSSSWQPVPWLDFSYRWSDASPVPVATVEFRVSNADFEFTPERSTTNRGQLCAELRITATIGSESEVLFQGRIARKTPADYELGFSAQDWGSLVFECEAIGEWEPDSLEVVDDASTREIFLLQDGALGLMYGFQSAGGSDPAFDSATRSRRRSLQPTGNCRLFYDSGATDEVPPRLYRPLWASGCWQILEDPTGKSYYVRSVRAYEEGTLDWSEVLIDALQYPAADGGMGIDPGDIDIDPLGLDLSTAVNYPRDPEQSAFVSDLIAEVQRAIGQNLRLWYRSSDQKWTARRVTQSAAGSEDWTLYAASSVQQPLELRGLSSRVVATGKTEKPVNALAHPDLLGLPAGSWTDLTGGATWSQWDGADVEGSPSGFAASMATLADGNHQLGPLASSIPGGPYALQSPNDYWIDLATRDFGEIIRCDGIRVRLGGSRCEHPLVGRGHYFVFHPGVQLLVSDDNSSWFPLAPELNKVRQAPFSLIELYGDQITRPRFRYLKWIGGLFKFGIDNISDPGATLAELEVFVNSSYRVVKEIQNSDAQGYYRYTRSRDLPITAVNTGAKTFTVAGNHSAAFTSGVRFAVEDSTGNDKLYTVVSSAYGVATVITVSETIPSGVADGNVVTDVWPNYHPELFKRLGNRGKTLHLPLANRYNERLAHDYALQRLAEGVRLFNRVQYRCAHADARPRGYDTLSGPDSFNGDTSFLCESIGIDVSAPAQPGDPGSESSEFAGTDYRAAALSNS